MDTGAYDVLFNRATSRAFAPREVAEKTARFRYRAAVHEVIRDCTGLDSEGHVFVRCTARILSNFKMTRSGPFKGVAIETDGSVNGQELLLECWRLVGRELLAIRGGIPGSGFARDRYLLELSESARTELLARTWSLTKRLLPRTSGKTSYGLVGASKVLFAVLPEIVLPVDNHQWLHLFKTVDMGDVINRMVHEIQYWEDTTGKSLNEMDPSRELTTLPSVYNVMAMNAR